MHFHDKKHESWRILSGMIRFHWIDTNTAEGKMCTLIEGDQVDIPRLTPHRVEAVTDCRILEISTQHFEDDSYRVAKGDSQK